MRFATFTHESATGPGVVTEDTIVDLGDLYPTLLAIVEAGSAGLEAARSRLADESGHRVRLDEVQLRAPFPEPRRCVFAVGLNYLDHFAEADAAATASGLPDHPSFFTKATGTVIGPGEEIGFDADLSERFDYEAELAVVIGAHARDISVEQAESHVFGYTLANDVSVRDVQRRHGGQVTKGKSIDRTCPLGPVVVTPDEIRLDELVIESEVNGERRQHAAVTDMIFSVAELIAELSMGMTVFPGDLLLTGTPAGVGYARKPPQYLKPGDEVIIRSEQIGELRNTVGETLGKLVGT